MLNGAPVLEVTKARLKLLGSHFSNSPRYPRHAIHPVQQKVQITVQEQIQIPNWMVDGWIVCLDPLVPHNTPEAQVTVKCRIVR